MHSVWNLVFCDYLLSLIVSWALLSFALEIVNRNADQIFGSFGETASLSLVGGLCLALLGTGLLWVQGNSNRDWNLFVFCDYFLILSLIVLWALLSFATSILFWAHSIRPKNTAD